jgi:hypothetical protein
MLLLLIVLIVILLDVGSAIILSDRTYMEFDGHVLCHFGNDTADVPVTNAEVTLMEEDGWFFTYTKSKFITILNLYLYVTF